jgi:hypothetical protein
MKKKGLLKLFGKGPQVPVPSREGTPIKAVKKWRDNKADGSPDSRKREPATSDKSNQCKKMQSDNEESKKFEVDVEGMEKMPLKSKRKKGDSAKKKKTKKDTGKDKSSDKGGEKKALFCRNSREGDC